MALLRSPAPSEAAAPITLPAGIGIPSCPRILLALRDELACEDTDLGAIGELITQDVALAAMLVRTVNSASFGLRRQVSSVQEALSMIGLRRVADAVHGLLLRQTLSPASAAQLDRFWDVSAKVALLAAHIARQVPQLIKGTSPEEAHTFALFQDAGIALLMQQIPTYKDTLAEANRATEKSFTEIETERHRTDHASVGYFLARTWGLPAHLSEAIRHHHRFEILDDCGAVPDASRYLVAMGLLAEHCVQEVTGQAHSSEWEKGGDAALNFLGFDPTTYQELLDGAQDLMQ